MIVTMQFPTAHKITTIKLFRFVAEIPLKEAKDLVEAKIPSEYVKGERNPNPVPDYVSLTMSITPDAYDRLVALLTQRAHDGTQATFEMQGYRILNAELEDGDANQISISLPQSALNKTVDELNVARAALLSHMTQLNQLNVTIPTWLSEAYDNVSYSYHRLLENFRQ